MQILFAQFQFFKPQNKKITKYLLFQKIYCTFAAVFSDNSIVNEQKFSNCRVSG